MLSHIDWGKYVRIILSLLLALTIANWAGAEQAPLRKLLTADEAKTWQAVGRINLNGAGFCTGALIAPDLVLTAAHCMYNPKSGAELKPQDIEFLAGWRSGRAAAKRKARRIVIHENYQPGREVRIDKVANDIAIIELEHPITTNFIKAFDYHTRPKIGDDVKVVSYAQDRSEAPSIEEPCKVIGHDPRALVLTCNVDYGASGSPVFIVKDGVPKIASVVSAKAVVDGNKVALGASLGASLEGLLTGLRANRGVFQGKKPGRKSISEQLGTVQAKAKILNP
jgi:V8-like Glu-specific endopeptidase